MREVKPDALPEQPIGRYLPDCMDNPCKAFVELRQRCEKAEAENKLLKAGVKGAYDRLPIFERRYPWQQDWVEKHAAAIKLSTAKNEQ